MTFIPRFKSRSIDIPNADAVAAQESRHRGTTPGMSIEDTDPLGIALRQRGVAHDEAQRQAYKANDPMGDAISGPARFHNSAFDDWSGFFQALRENGVTKLRQGKNGLPPSLRALDNPQPWSMG